MNLLVMKMAEHKRAAKQRIVGKVLDRGVLGVEEEVADG